MITKEIEDRMRTAGLPAALINNLIMSQKLNEILVDHPIDGLDLNPHLQVLWVADQVVEYMRNEKQEKVDREDVILLWLTENIMGHRTDRARMDPLL